MTFDLRTHKLLPAGSKLEGKSWMFYEPVSQYDPSIQWRKACVRVASKYLLG